MYNLEEDMLQSSLHENELVKKQNFLTTQAGFEPNIGSTTIQKVKEETVRGALDNAELDKSGVSGPSGPSGPLGTKNRLE